MNRFCNILVICVALATTLLFACSNETDTTLTTQQESISRYLTSSHQPRLIPEEDVANSVEEEPEYYTHWGLDIYRYISTMYTEGRDSRTIVEMGDKLAITYTAYIFNGNAPSTTNMFATNDEESLAKLQQSGLTTEYEWTTEPYTFTMGGGVVLSSIETALEGCREGDKVEIYLSFEAGYGNDYIGKVPSKSALVWFIEINSVTK